MELKTHVLEFFKAVIEQNPKSLKHCFASKAKIYWHNTNEEFNVADYIKANCEYPGQWDGIVERIEIIDNLAISVTKVWQVGEGISFHATSFIKYENDLIVSLDEYWGDDGHPPQWRQEKQIGKPIK